jgi:exodeoxyribonuclease VII small subunit
VDFEKKLGRIEQIVQAMEKGDVALEESLKLFEEGVRLSRDCQTQLSQAEAQVQKLVGVDSAGQPILKPFVDDDAKAEKK